MELWLNDLKHLSVDSLALLNLFQSSYDNPILQITFFPLQNHLQLFDYSSNTS